MIDTKAVKKAYKKQINNCKNRVDVLGNPVEMRMTLQQFADKWIQSGHWDLRGVGKGKYCMARHNDIGHYEWNNVEIKLHGENISEANKGKPRSAETKAKIAAGRKGKLSPIKGKPKPKVQCPNCGTWGPSNNMKRYHFDNCKQPYRRVLKTFDSQTD